MDERRTYTRQEISLRVEVKREGRTTSGQSLNLSMVGLFFPAEKTHPVGTRVQLALVLPDETAPIEVRSEVVHSIPGSGMGFRFDAFLAGGETRLRGFLGPGTRID